MSIIRELKRRNVFRVAVAYLTGAWLLVEVTETLFPIYGLSDAAIRLVVTLVAIGFPLTLLFSWVFEFTPDGFRLEKNIDPSTTPVHPSGKKLDRVIIVLLALALGYFVFDKFVLEPEREAEIAREAARATEQQAMERSAPDTAARSIAVLPFTNLGPDLENEYFSDGLTEELIGALAKVEGLQVTARTSAFAFKGANEDIRDIGKRLNVKTVLEGSVRREQGRVRVSAQLISTEDGFHLWSESYEYELQSVLALQDTISRAIVDALQIRLSPRVDEQFSASAKVNPEAYDLYLKGLYYWARLSLGGLQQSIEAFQKAIAIDPHYAPPHAGLANAYSFAGYLGLMAPREAFPLSITEAEAALAIDPELSDALIARGMAWLMYEWDWERAREDLERALELSPNASLAHWAHAEYLMVTDPGAALGSALRALALDPLSLPIMNLVAFNYMQQGRYAEAIQMDEEMLAMEPGFAPAHWNLGVIRVLHEQFDEAIVDLGRAVEYSGGIPSTRAVQAYAYARSGNEGEALAIAAELADLRGSTDHGYASSVMIAYVYEGLGRTADALAWLEQAVEERDGWLVYINVFPRLESLRGEPRFQDVLRRVGLPEAPGS
jgi:adenylate cyclase